MTDLPGFILSGLHSPDWRLPRASFATPRLTAEEQEYFRMLQTHNSFMTRLANLFTYKDPAFNKEA